MDEMFEKLSIKYNELGEAVLSNSNEIQWEKIVIRIKKDKNNNLLGFYYKVDGKYYISGDLVNLNKMSIQTANMMLMDVDDIADEIIDILKAYGQEIWTQMIVIIDENNKISIDYSYDKLADDIFKDDTIWQYKNLGMLPDSEHLNYIENITPEIL